MAPVPSLDRVNEVFRLDPETGKLWWRISLGSRGHEEAEAGYLHKASGYWIVGLDGHRYRQHVLIWFMLYGEWCPRLVDHEDRDRGNNRPANLRKATESQQRQNAAMRNDNTSGERGVRRHACGKHVARLYVNGKEKHLGLFTSFEAAREVVRAARLEQYGAFAPSYDQAR